ncbi:MAG: glycosyltransferase family 4 protein [Eubacterium sp.]|nr:glycosyltransferase family 4 protein [Eubacterium sp.]
MKLEKEKVLMLSSVASMIDQFNMPNIRLLLEMGYEVHVACNFTDGNTCDKRRVQTLCQTLRGMQVALHQWDCPRKLRPVKNCLLAYRQLLELMGRIRFAWMHCHSPIGGALARLAAHRNGIPVAYTAHGFHFYKGAPVKNWLVYYPAEKLLAHWTDILITINREDDALARQKLRAGKICRLPGIGIDTCRFSSNGAYGHREFCRQYQIPEQAVMLLSVGELSDRKNHQVVIKALADMHRQDVYYIICGQGRLRGELRRLAATLGVEARVRMTGFQKDVERLYRNADIFVFPSRQEGMPVALMEAMASGLVCAVSDIRGNRELIDEKGGILFPPDDPEGLRVGLEKLLEHPSVWQECGSYNQVKVKPYGKEHVMRRMERIYTMMAGNSLDSKEREDEKKEESSGTVICL